MTILCIYSCTKIVFQVQKKTDNILYVQYMIYLLTLSIKIPLKKFELIETESRKVVPRGEVVANVSSVIGCVESGDLVYNMVTYI